MIPILYESNETAFSTNGIGPLPDAVSCTVTEQLNGEYELEMVYPLSGVHADLLENDRLILAEPSDGRAPEPFRIYRMEETIDGQITVNARHISYWLSDIPVLPFTSESAADFLVKLKSYSAQTNPFTFSTNITEQGEYSLTAPMSSRALLADETMMSVYGSPEFYFSRFNVQMLSRRGSDTSVTIRYGKNLTDFNQEKNIESLLTGICPYWAKDAVVVTLPEKVINLSTSLSYPRTAVVDLSSLFEEEPTVAELRTAAQAYIDEHQIGTPDVSITVSFVALWQTEEYKDIAPLERVNLGDMIKVVFDKLGVETSARVVETDYNVLLGRYDSIVIGSERQNFASTFVREQAEVKEEFVRVTNNIDEATQLITGNRGGYVAIKDTTGDGKPDEILVMDSPSIATAQKIWRWNLGGLGYSNTGYNGQYGLAITQNGQIVADYIKTGTLSNFSGTFALDFTGTDGIVLTDNGSDGIPSLKIEQSGSTQYANIFSAGAWFYGASSSDFAYYSSGGYGINANGASGQYLGGFLNVSKGTDYLMFDALSDTKSFVSTVPLYIGSEKVALLSEVPTQTQVAQLEGAVSNLSAMVARHEAWILQHS